MLAGMIARPPPLDLAPHQFGVHPLADRNELHLRGDVAPAGVVQLGDRPVPPKDPAPEPGRHREPEGLVPVADFRDIPFQQPGESNRWEAFPDIVARRSARVVHPERWLAAGEDDLPHRNPDAVSALDVHLAGVGKGVAVVGAWLRDGKLSSGHT